MADKETNILDHVSELRKRLFYIGFAFVFFIIVALVFVTDIYAYLTRQIEPAKLIVLGPSDPIKIYFSLATYVATACVIPFIALQIWLFVKPALKKREIKVTATYIPAVFICFILGIAFGYYFIFPNIFEFLQRFGLEQMQASYEVTKYFDFLIYITLPFGILFELPIAMMFLTSIGIMNPYVVVRLRKYAYLVLIILGIVISPPEFLSEIITIAPFLALFEISILISKIVYKKRLKKAAQAKEGEEAKE